MQADDVCFLKVQYLNSDERYSSISLPTISHILFCYFN